MHNLVLIEKYSKNDRFWKNLIKFNKTEFTVDEIVEKYNGFEGELLCYSIFDFIRLNEFIKFCDEVHTSSNTLLLHVFTDFSKMPENLINKTVFVGYDVGVCDEEKTLYSSVFNEVLFGNLKELICFGSNLNNNLLFSKRDSAENYIHLHNELSVLNKGVEDYETMNIYEIWRHIS